jgi:hypothetical protein
VQALPSDDGVSVRHVCTGVTKEAATILSQVSIELLIVFFKLPAPLHIIAFTGFGRTGRK